MSLYELWVTYSRNLSCNILEPKLIMGKWTMNKGVGCGHNYIWLWLTLNPYTLHNLLLMSLSQPTDFCCWAVIFVLLLRFIWFIWKVHLQRKRETDPPSAGSLLGVGREEATSFNQLSQLDGRPKHVSCFFRHNSSKLDQTVNSWDLN